MSDPTTTFGIGSVIVDERGIALNQHVGTPLVDHRGRVEMPAYAVTAESVTSGAYWYAFRESVATVQAWLAMTAGAPVAVGTVLRAAATLTYRDDTHGTASMTVTDGSGNVVCTGAARAVRVGRMTDSLRAIDKDALSETPRDAAVASDDVPAPPAIPREWDGGRILSAIRRDEITAGPLCDLLGMTLTNAGQPVVAVEPRPWMANPLGAIQGGVMASIIGQACSLAGQAHTAPGDAYSLADLSIHYFRSPQVDAGRLTLVTETERVGRRLVTVSAVMSDAAGKVYAHAVADIAYDRSAQGR